MEPRLSVRIALLVSVLLNASLVISALLDVPWRGVRGSTARLGPFSVARSPGLNPGSTRYLIGFQNGRFYWSVEEQMVSMNVGLQQSATFRINPTNDRVEGITLELEPAPGQGFYVSDVNADGIPDRKQSKTGANKQIFYEGRFVDVAAENGVEYITEGGRRQAVAFSNGRWRPVP